MQDALKMQLLLALCIIYQDNVFQNKICCIVKCSFSLQEENYCCKIKIYFCVFEEVAAAEDDGIVVL